MLRPLTASLALLTVVGLTACTASGQTPGSQPAGPTTTVTSVAVQPAELSAAAVLATLADATTVRDDEWAAADAVAIELLGSTASSEAAAVSSAGSVVTIGAAGVYRLTGTLNGAVVVAAPEDAQVVLILNGVHITNPDGPAITVTGADDVAISLAEGSRNEVSDAASYPEEAQAHAAIHSSADLTLTGTGALTVRGNGADAVFTSDDLAVISGTYTVEAADDALVGKDSITVEGGTLNLTAAGDGLSSDKLDDQTKGYVRIVDGQLSLAVGDDGIAATTDAVVEGGVVTVSAAGDGLHADRVLVIEGGKVSVTASTEGLEGATVAIGGGEVNVVASDDGINAAGSGETLTITGGTVTVDATGDGLDSNGSLSIAGGEVRVYGPQADGNGIFDADGQFSISGGTLLGIGSSGMAQTPAEGSQGWVAATLDVAAGTLVGLSDGAGAEVASVTTPRAATMILYSAPAVPAGATYSVTAGGATIAAATQAAVSGAQRGGPGGPGGSGRRP